MKTGNEKWFKNKILYVNAVLFLVVAIFAVDTFSTRGSAFIRQAVAAVNAIGIESGGTVNYLSRFVGASGSNQIGDSVIYDDGTNVGIGTTTPSAKLEVRKDDGVTSGWHSVADFSRAGGADAELVLGYYANGSSAVGPMVYAANNKPLLFATGAAERMRIDSSGNVGIGTTAPGEKLHVAGNIRASTIYASEPPDYGQTALYSFGLVNGTGHIYIEPQAGKNLYLTDNWSGTGQLQSRFATTVFVNGDNTAYTPVYASDYYSSSAGTWMSLLCRSDGTNCPAGGGGQWTTSGTNIYNSNTGNVGIGTTSPVNKLDVNGGLRSIGYTAPTSGTGLEMFWYGAGNYGTVFPYDRSTSTYKPLYLEGSVVSLNPNSGGNVGIGTTSPAYKLDVYGPSANYPARVRSPDGYLLFGPANTGWSHFETDRARYYFNTGITVDTGNIGSYAQNLNLQTSGTTRISVSNATGNVGIGTASPTSPASVNRFLQISGSAHAGIVLTDTDNASSWEIWNDEGRLYSWKGGYYGWFIGTTGDVGIGTTSPGAKLEVNGAIKLTPGAPTGTLTNGMMWMQ